MGTSTYAGTFILGIEWVHTDYRVLGSMIVALAFPIGEILLGVFAMFIHDFRYLLRVSVNLIGYTIHCIPPFQLRFILFCVFVVPVWTGYIFHHLLVDRTGIDTMVVS